MKRAVKNGLLAVSHDAPEGEGRSCILTYHSVGDRDHEMNVQPAAFDEQMAWLCDSRPLLTLEEAAQGRDGVAVTFDDGYADNLREAAPILCRRAVPATVFVVAGRLGAWLDHDRQSEAARLMTDVEVRELEAMGVSIGAHTMTHPRLAQLDEAAQRREIAESFNFLAGLLGHSVSAFAYPFGTARDYTETTVQIVRETGFRLACSNRYGINRKYALEPWALRRIWIDGSDSLHMFQAKVDGRLDRLALLESPLGLALRHALNASAGENQR